MYATSSHEQTGDIITFTPFEEGNLVENECNVAEYESISDSIDESSTYDDSDDGFISMNAFGSIRNGKFVRPYINARYSRFKIRYCIRQTKKWMERGITLSKDNGKNFTYII